MVGGRTAAWKTPPQPLVQARGSAESAAINREPFQTGWWGIAFALVPMNKAPRGRVFHTSAVRAKPFPRPIRDNRNNSGRQPMLREAWIVASRSLRSAGGVGRKERRPGFTLRPAADRLEARVVLSGVLVEGSGRGSPPAVPGFA